MGSYSGAAKVESPSAPAVNDVSMKRALIVMSIGLVAHAFTAIWVKTSNFEPVTSAFLRCAIAILVLIPFAFWEFKRVGGMSRKGIILALFSGIFLGIDFMCYNYSIFYAGAGIAQILLNIQIIILPLLAVVFDGYRPNKIFWFLIPVLLFGMALTGGVFDAAPATGPATIYGIRTSLLGTLLGAASGTCYGFYLYYSRKSGTLNPGRFVQPMLWSIIAQTIPQLAFMFTLAPRGWDITHGVLVNGHLPANAETTLGDPITGMSWFYIIILGIIGQAMCWLFIQYGSVRVEPSLGATMLLMSPIATVAIAGVLLGERPSLLQWIGIVIVLTTVAYQNKVFAALSGLLKRSGPKPS